MTLPDHVLVAGAGVSGLGAAHLLTKAGANFTVVDDNPDGRAAATAKGFAVCSSAEARERFADTGLVVTSPGWRPDTPLLVDATAATLIYRIISFALITAIGWVVHVVCYAGRGYMLGAPSRSGVGSGGQ